MAQYSLGIASTVVTNNVAAWGFLAQADANPRITEIIVSQATTTASTYGFGRAATAGTQTAPVTVLPDNAGDITTAKSTCAVAWSGGAAPTVPAAYLRRFTLGAVAGDVAILVFPNGIGVAAGQEMVLWNLATNSASINVNVSSIE